MDHKCFDYRSLKRKLRHYGEGRSIMKASMGRERICNIFLLLLRYAEPTREK